MRSQETEALRFSARLDGYWPPHRCRIKDLRSSLVAKVRRVTVIAMIAGGLALWGGCSVAGQGRNACVGGLLCVERFVMTHFCVQ